MSLPSDASPQAATRTIDLADLLLQVCEQLGTDAIDAYLFGSRRHRRGEVASDIDILLFLDGTIMDHDAQAIWHMEPYLNIFYGTNGCVRSIANESTIACSDRASLIDDLAAIPLYLDGQWQDQSDDWRIQKVLAGVSPPLARTSLFSPSASPPGDLADVLAVMALPYEYRAAIAEFGIMPESERSRAEVRDTTGRTLIVELVLISSMGSVQAALEAYDSLRRTKASHVVLLGTAAGIPGELGLGDVILPEQIYYYESAEITNQGEIGSAIWKTTNADVRRAASVFAEAAKGDWAVSIITSGAILASGEKVVASDSSRNYEYHALAACNSARVFFFLVRKGAFRSLL